MESEAETRSVARGLIDAELDLCYSREDMALDFDFGSDDDPLVKRFGRDEYQRRLTVADQRYRHRYPENVSATGAGQRGRTDSDGSTSRSR